MNLEKRKIPRIALMDFFSRIAVILKKEKFEVYSGSFGSTNGYRRLPCPPYEVDIFFHEPRNYIERDLAIKGRGAITDETPYFTDEQIEDRILRGGVFICFISSSVVKSSNLARELYYKSLPCQLDTEDAVSNYIKLVHQKDLWGSLFRENRLKLPVIGKLDLSTSIPGVSQINVIAENENKDSIAAEIRYGKGCVYLFPEFKSNDWAIQVLLKEILPKIKPELFPEYKPTKWINDQAYKFKDVLLIEEKLNKLSQKYEKEKVKLEEAAQKKESELRSFKCLLVSTDEEDKFDKTDILSSCVERTLKYLRFQVRNIDEERKKQRKDKREDFHISDGKFFALVECQGTQGECKEEYFNKVVGYMNLYKTESGKIDIQGLLIINYLRLMPPVQRPGMFEKHARGEEMGYKAIARALNEQGIPSPNGGYWGDSTIGSIIRNPFYYGRLTWNKTSKGRFYRICKEKGEEQPKIRLQRIRTNPKDDWLIKEDDHERIITKAEWMKAQAKRGHDKRENKAGCRVNNIAVRGETNVSPYLLSGLIKCAACGHNFQGHKKRVGDRKYRYYVCGGYRSKGSYVCEEHHFSAETIERYVLEQIREEFLKHVTRKRLLSDLEEQFGVKFKDSTEELKQIDNALKENKKKAEGLLDNVDERHKDILNEMLDKLKAERQFLEEEREKLLSQKKRKVNFREAAHEILEYLSNADQVLAKGTAQEKKVYVRQFITGIKILPDKGEGIVGFYAFPQVDEASNQLGKSRASAMPYFLSAEGGICTFAEIFRRTKILKRFSCQTGVTMETIRVNQAG